MADVSVGVIGPEKVMETLEHLKSRQDSIDKGLQDLQSRVSERGTGPFIRTGESALTSRGFSYLKMFGVMAKCLPAEYAKVELELCDRIRKAHDGAGFVREYTNGVVAPMSSQFMSLTHRDEALAREVGEVVRAGILGYDREEVQRYRQKYWGVQKALSWTDDSQGGALVPPPQMGELIELLRNNEIFMQAGARVLGMPPNGRIIWPRQTGPATAYWVGTGSQDRSITESNQTTGDVVLTAKKLAIRVTIPNELFRFASVSIEQFVRDDMARVLALKLDKTFLDNNTGTGNELEPKGLLNYAGITSHTASTVGTDGDTFEVEDVAQLIGKVEEQNATFKAFVMRPLMYTALSTRRADAVSAGDKKGQWLFNMWREMQSEYVDPTRMKVGALNGYPVFKSTQVSNTRTKGAGSALTYILGGDFSDFLIALSGTMEFQANPWGDTAFTQDQTVFRGLMFADGAPRHEASFVKCDTLRIA